MDPAPQPLLTGYDAKRCQRRVHNDHDPTINKMSWKPPQRLKQLFDDGIAFEAEVFAAIQASLPTHQWRDIGEIRGEEASTEATVAAMDEGVELILGGRLPDDLVGGRVGKPDLLLKVGSAYVPGDVKRHLMMRRTSRGAAEYSTISDATHLRAAEGLSIRVSDRIDDYLQLAHYWRMLQACDRAAPGDARGFIIGTDNLIHLDPTGFALSWLELERPLFLTFSRRQGKAKRTAMERYDFELGIRRDIARVAEARSGAADDPEPLVKPIFIEECDACPWHDYCLEQAGAAASAHITSGRLDVREWRALDQLGITTLDELADLVPDVEDFASRYLPEVTHRADAMARLSTVIRRARMIRDGIAVERLTDGPVRVPRADIEIDFDLEDAQRRVYLWGVIITDSEEAPAYEPIVSWKPLDEESERELARRFVHRLREICSEAAANGRTVLAYHYTSHELGHLSRILGEEEIADLRDIFVDLFDVVRAHYFGASGLGLKNVAPAFGFHWRDEEPSGLLSQLWYLDATQSEDPTLADEARKRLLDYNEDDVRATLAVREGIADPEMSGGHAT